ncbi:MAG: hypothetical protein ACP5KN_05530 [Armatimonadota bacterium]
MIDVLGRGFQVLMEAGGGSDLLPMIAFSVLVVLLGVGLGLLIMRKLVRSRPGSSEPEPEQPQ